MWLVMDEVMLLARTCVAQAEGVGERHEDPKKVGRSVRECHAASAWPRKFWAIMAPVVRSNARWTLG
eukprot:CAMPEP_0113591030 /NCGR_PEP_ID=MMETSP0015_2-20120614/37020_1 /TAXON_ID=2838 /ORGANISM="Odontella" /LENGTH=66 /DNA_ID=CAMNT_0000497321 /DNA_START=144 /DNA_END=344 /DNA_ORIENTATION=- /assembly_acc=CAM_ASM_000160